MTDDSVDRLRFFDKRDDSHPAVTGRTDQWIHLVDLTGIISAHPLPSALPVSRVYYTEDATLLPPPNAPIIKGREGIEAYWATGFQMGLKDVVLTTVEVMAMGDMVCEIGEADATFHPEGMDAFKDKGKYLVIWKNVDGAWKLYVDIYNSSLPAQ